MRRMSIRFEDSAIQMRRINAIHLDDLGRTSEAGDDSNRGNGDTGKSSEVPDDRLVRLAVHRGSGDVQLPTVAVSAREFSLAGAGADLKRRSEERRVGKECR